MSVSRPVMGCCIIFTPTAPPIRQCPGVPCRSLSYYYTHCIGPVGRDVTMENTSQRAHRVWQSCESWHPALWIKWGTRFNQEIVATAKLCWHDVWLSLTDILLNLITWWNNNHVCRILMAGCSWCALIFSKKVKTRQCQVKCADKTFEIKTD